MLAMTARLVVRRPVGVLVVALVFVVACGVFGAGVIDRLSPGGFDDPGSESARAAVALEERFGIGAPNLVLLIEAQHGGTVDDADVVEAGIAVSEQLAAEPNVTQVTSYWLAGRPEALRADDGTQALVVARILGTEIEVQERVTALAPQLVRDDDAISVRLGGSAEVERELTETSEEDLRRAERFTVPLTLLLLVFVFGGVVAASLPIAIGVFAIFGAFGALQVISGTADVSVFALNLISLLGLGLAIDYSLFTLSRFREELQAGYTTDEAVSRSVQIAGRTVAFSAATLMLALSALLVFPPFLLRSFAYAGVAVVAIAGVGAVVVLPAMLRLLGPRVDRLAIIRRSTRTRGEGVWYRLAKAIMRRPLPAAILVTTLLVLLAVPFLQAEFSLPDDRVLPIGADSRATADQIRDNFGGAETGALSVIATDTGDPTDRLAAIDEYATSLSLLAAVVRIEGPTGIHADGHLVAPPDERSAAFLTDDAFFLSVVPSVEPFSVDGEQLVATVREQASPFTTMVAGDAAGLVDTKAVIGQRLPIAAGIILLGTVVLLFLLFGSVVAPIKAVVLNLLSLTAMFGVIVWVFQDGNLSDALGFTPTGTVDIAIPILMFCLAFGLSMDYEMFILSRVREEYDLTGDHDEAIAIGIQRTAGILTASAGVLAVVFIAFATSGVQLLKMFGIGMAVAVVVDATLVRGVLVPAVMKLAGPATWWAPKPLRRLHDRWGIAEQVDLTELTAEEFAVAAQPLAAPAAAAPPPPPTVGTPPPPVTTPPPPVTTPPPPVTTPPPPVTTPGPSSTAGLAVPLSTSSPRQIAELDLVSSLGRDRHSEVYLAQAPDRHGAFYVAVRLYDDIFTKADFAVAARELRAYLKAESPKLARLYEIGLWHGRLYFTSEFVPLGSLATPAQPINLQQRLRAVADAARAAHELHEVGVVHRDLRPRSIVLGPDGGKLAGIGVPQLLAEGRRDPRLSLAPRSLEASPVGAIEYIDPMVVQGRPSGRASDIWSLGATLHDVLAGTSLYGELPEDPAARVEAVTAGRPAPAGTMSEDQQTVVRACIDPDLARRYPTAEVVADAVEGLLGASHDEVQR